MKKIVTALGLIMVFMCSFYGQVQESMPYCFSPQPISPMYCAGDNIGYFRAPVVWNGKDYALIYTNITGTYFQRFFADGTPAANPVIMPFTWADPSIVFNGSGYGVAYQSYTLEGYYQIYFVKLDMNGNVMSGPTKVSSVGQTQTYDCFAPFVAFSSNGYCVVFHTSQNQVLATILNLDGTIGGSGSYHDIRIDNGTYANFPRVCWSQYGRYQIVWQDLRNGKCEIFGNQLLNNGGIAGETLLVSPLGSNALDPSLTSSGSGMGLVWCDSRDGNFEIYFCRLNLQGSKVGGDIRLTNNSFISANPFIVWNGAEYGVFWQDDRTGNYDTWFQRVSASGTVEGVNTQVTYSPNIEKPSAAFAKFGYLVTGTSNGGPNYIQSIGCNYEYSPPTCPGNLLAYNITGTSATISWSPSGDTETDLAYYIVYRNNQEIAKTSNTYYTDTGLSLSTTYNYMVQPVNAAQMQNYSCTSSIYTKTNATLTLMVNKNDPNAHLYWNDAGLNNYNVFRGTSPQVMTLIGSTSGQEVDDQNVLLDNVTYYYTVDDPGQ